MNAKTTAAIVKHGETLKMVFGLDKKTDPVKLCKALRKLERKGAALALRGCNGPEWASEEAEDAAYVVVLSQVEKLLNVSASGVPVFCNRDPRGYCLKVPTEFVLAHFELTRDLYKDWGSFGIIAPDLTVE